VIILTGVIGMLCLRGKNMSKLQSNQSVTSEKCYFCDGIGCLEDSVICEFCYGTGENLDNE